MKHLMIDLETLGTDPDCPILTIGAVFFSVTTGKLGESFYTRVDLQSNLDLGRVPSDETADWWLQQTDEARNAAFYDGEGLGLNEALLKLVQFITENSLAPVVWSNGLNFDVAILQDAFKKLAIMAPWNFWDLMDVRTIKALSKGAISINDFKIEGEKHNALADAKFQATFVSAMWQHLRGVNK